ncbi:hypothetical protein [Thomasclavelia cocleata]|jgi:hypothetical protein|uniref:hypothetical protein n=1 Tax=Thomasclavelia cocleata TaxID=69824 RepID=UPI00241D9D28|nr:hypothetical protein [Thomasclavelia cocleata]
MIGIESFKQYFKGFENQYVIIGGTACELLMSEQELDFRATKDIDMVLIVETLSKEFGEIFWKYVQDAGYEHINKSTSEAGVYCFSDPKSPNYPKMIELFSRKQDWFLPRKDQNIAPIHVDDEISSLSAILLDDNYYVFLRDGISMIDGVSILNVEHIIPFKAKAWLDLKTRKERGEHVDSRDIKKHRNDVIRLSILLTPITKVDIPNAIKEDLSQFIQNLDKEELNLKQLGIRNMNKNTLIQLLCQVYELPIFQNV